MNDLSAMAQLVSAPGVGSSAWLGLPESVHWMIAGTLMAFGIMCLAYHASFCRECRYDLTYGAENSGNSCPKCPACKLLRFFGRVRRNLAELRIEKGNHVKHFIGSWCIGVGVGCLLNVLKGMVYVMFWGFVFHKGVQWPNDQAETPEKKP